MGEIHRGMAPPVADPWSRTAVIRATLSDLVAHAGEGDSVAIPAGLAPEPSTVEIRKNLHLFSAGGAELADRIVVRGGADLQLSGLSRTGVTVAHEGARISARGCRFEAPDGGPAVLVSDNSRFTAVACRFTGGKANAVLVRGGGSARFTDCDLRSFERPAVIAEDTRSAVQLTRCRFTGMTGHAVLVERGAHARAADCAFDGFGATAWTAVIAVTSGAGADLANCRLSRVRADGLLVRGGGRVRAVGCRFEDFDSGRDAVIADDPATRAELSGCLFTGIAGHAVTAFRGATVCVTDSTAEVGGIDPALAVDGPGSSVEVLGCRITTTASAAAAATFDAEVTISDSSIDTPRGNGLLHPNIDLGPDGSRLRVTGGCSFRGSTVRAVAGVKHRDIAAGATVSMPAVLPTPCQDCNGSGGPPGAVLRACDGCDPHRPGSQSCAQCRGTRFVSEGRCAPCDGRGEQSAERIIEVVIPGDAKPGDTLVAPGRGGPGLRDGASGDLRVVLGDTDAPYRSVEEFVEKKLGIRIAGEHGDPAPGHTLDTAARRALDEAVRREAIRLGYLASDDPSAITESSHPDPLRCGDKGTREPAPRP